MDKENFDLFTDAVTSRPLHFTVDGKAFAIPPKSLGMMMITSRLREQLEVNEDNVKLNPMLEMLRVCEDKRDVACMMLAYSTARSKGEVYDPERLKKTTRFFDKHLTLDELAALLGHVIGDEQDTLDKLRSQFKMNEEQRDREEVQSVRNNGRSLLFGGRSLYGSLIDFFANRYGWTMDYIVWGVSYVNLMILYADHPESVYLSDEEFNKLSTPLKNRLKHKGDSTIKATKENMERIKSLNWK